MTWTDLKSIQKEDPSNYKKCLICEKTKPKKTGFYYRKDKKIYRSICKRCYLLRQSKLRQQKKNDPNYKTNHAWHPKVKEAFTARCIIIKTNKQIKDGILKNSDYKKNEEAYQKPIIGIWTNDGSVERFDNVYVLAEKLEHFKSEKINPGIVIARIKLPVIKPERLFRKNFKFPNWFFNEDCSPLTPNEKYAFGFSRNYFGHIYLIFEDLWLSKQEEAKKNPKQTADLLLTYKPKKK